MKHLHKKIKALWSRTEESEPWQISAARYCVEHNVFGESELIHYIETELKQTNATALKFLQENIYFPPGSTYPRTPLDENGSWYAPTELVSKVTDYDELREARRNASSAWKMALLALLVSGIGAIFQGLDFFFK